MVKAICASNMRHVENTINNKEISDLNKHLHTIAPKLGNVVFCKTFLPQGMRTNLYCGNNDGQKTVPHLE